MRAERAAGTPESRMGQRLRFHRIPLQQERTPVSVLSESRKGVGRLNNIELTYLDEGFSPLKVEEGGRTQTDIF